MSLKNELIVGFSTTVLASFCSWVITSNNAEEVLNNTMTIMAKTIELQSKHIKTLQDCCR